MRIPLRTRTAGLVAAGAFICQFAAAATFVLGTTAILEGPAGGSSTVVLGASAPTATWTATNNAAWLNVIPSGEGSANVEFSYDPNSGGTRTGTLTIAGLTLTVTQAGSNYVAAPGPVTALVSTGLNMAWDAEPDDAGNVYIADYGDNAVKEWVAASNIVVTLVSSNLSGPQGVAVDPYGNVYIADSGNNAVKKWNVTNHTVVTLFSNVVSNPYGVALDAAGNVCVADFNGDTVKEWMAANSNITTLVTSSNLNGPTSVSLDVAGNVYISDYFDNEVLEWTAANSNLVSLFVPLSDEGPNGVAVSGAGNIYVADEGNYNIEEWMPVSYNLTSLISSGLSTPQKVSVDGSGNVYIADRDNNAVKELPYAFVDPTPKSEAPGVGSDTLPAVLPTTANLLAPFAPTANQSWLTITGVSNGVVSFAFTANTSGSNRTANLTVLGETIPVTQSSAAIPVVSWNNPAPITYGTTLSALQLNATNLSTPGTFSYNPPAGTLLPAGTNTLSTIFTPLDTNDYVVVTNTVSLIVFPASLAVTANAESKNYGQTVTFGSGSTLFTSVGLSINETIGSVTLAVNGNGGAATAAVGSYTITPSAATGGTFNAHNYTITYKTNALTVNAAGLTVTASPQTKTYGQTVTLGSGSTLFTSVGLSNNETIGSVTLAVSGNGGAATAAVGGYTITPSAATGGTFNANNYIITYGTNALTVNAAGLTVTASPESKTYGQTVTFSSGSTLFTSVGLSNNETIGSVALAVSGNGGAATAAVGSYTITPSAATGGTFNANNYIIAYHTNTLTVNAAGLTVTASPQSKTYGQTVTFGGGSALFTSVGLSNNETIGSVTLAVNGNGGAATAAVGSYTITPSAATGGTFNANNYIITYHTNTLMVNAAGLTVTASPQSKTYGQTVTFGSNSTLFTSVGLSNNETIGSVTLAVTGNGGAATAAVGSYTITPSAATGGTFNANNYIITYDTNTLTVNAAGLTVTASPQSKTYGQTVTFGGGSALFTSVGLSNNETIGSVTLAVTGNGGAATAAVGSYTITPSAATGGTFNANNYIITYHTNTLMVNAAGLTVTASPQSKTYGQTVTFGSNSTLFTSVGLSNNETIGSVTLAVTGNGGAATAAVGSYTITPSAATGGTFNANNYIITYDTNTLTVNAAGLTVTANAQSKTYGQTVTFGSNSTLFTSVGLSNNETIGSVTLAVTGNGGAATAAVGSYTITPSAATGGTFNANNYIITYDTNTLMVNAAGLTVTANAQSKTYGQTVAFGSGSTLFTSVGLSNNETIGSVTMAVTGNGGAATAAVGSYTITPSAATGGTFNANNYIITYNTNTLTVNAAGLTVTANAQSKTYGQTVTFGSGSTLFTSVGLSNNETIGSVTLAVNGNGGVATAAVGNYTITPSAAAGGTFNANNYIITYNTNTLTVNAVGLTVTASPQSKTYGQTVTFGSGSTLFTSIGLSNNETIGSVTLAVSGNGGAATASVGGYTITPSAATGGTFNANNYTITYNTNTLTVNVAGLTVTANAQSKNYGQTVTFGSNSTLFTSVGLSNNETIGAVTLAVSGNGGAATAAVGSYTITPSTATGGTFNANNYIITYNTNTLTVNAVGLTVTASPQSKTYGQTVTFGSNSTLFTSVGLSNNETIGAVTLAVTGNGGAATAAVGSYAITPSAATGGTFNASNYSISYNTNTLTVNAAGLTVTASPQSKTYGQTVTFGSGSALFTSVGLSNNETIGSVTLAVTGNGGAATAAVGSYTITPSAATGGTFNANNYIITYNTNTLTVNAVGLTVTASPQSKTYGQTVTFGSGSALFTSVGLSNNETIGAVTLAVSGNGGAATASVGGYTITPSAATGGTFNANNYTITYNTNTLTVNAVGLTVTASPQSKTYGQTVTFGSGSALFTSVGLSNNETIGSVTLAVSGNGGAATSAAGNYTITPGAATGGTFNANNYTITYNTNTLTVNVAGLTVTVSNTMRAYGLANPVFTGTIVGLANADNITASFSCSATPASQVGIYPIALSLADPNNRLPNYAVATNGGVLNIIQAAPTLTWTPAPITYGTALGGTNGLNATASAPGTFTYFIMPASTPLSAGTVLSPGSNTLGVVFTPTDGTDYQSVSSNTTLVVLPAPLNVVASNITMNFGSPVPPLTAIYSGFVNGETASVLSGSPALSTAANSSSLPGIYPISVSVGTLRAANYGFTFTPGAVTVVGPPPSNLVINGGFETGDFTSWTLSGNSGNTTVVGNPANSGYVHSGTYAADLDATGTNATISQQILTAQGQYYQISFWLVNPTAAPGLMSLSVAWNGSPWIFQQYSGAFGYTNIQFVAPATSTSATLAFTFQNAAGFGLDDVTVTNVAVAVGQSGSPVYAFKTMAGDPIFGSSDGVGSDASFHNNSGVAVDTNDNVYVADTGNNTIRMITPEGQVSTIAGVPGVSGFADGTGSAALFSSPCGIAVDSAGNLYVADELNLAIRKMTPNGANWAVTTLAGGTNGQFGGPFGVAVDNMGDVYVADYVSSTVREVTPSGAVTTLPGVFNHPQGVAVDGMRNVYVADTLDGYVQMITPAGAVSTISASVYNDVQNPEPSGISLDTAGILYVSDAANNMILKITPQDPGWVAATMAGSPSAGNADGEGNSAQFDNPLGMAVDGAGTVYVADSGNSIIRSISPPGSVTTIAGSIGSAGSANGTGGTAHFYGPEGVAVNSAGYIYVADSVNDTIRKITPLGDVTTLAGSAGQAGATNGVGNYALFTRPTGIAVDTAGNAYVADAGNNLIRVISPAGVVNTIAGSGQTGFIDGTNIFAQFHNPSGIALDNAGNLYVADTGNNAIRKIIRVVAGATTNWVVNTIAGSGQIGYADGLSNSAQFYQPAGVAVDGAGNVYVADTGNFTIRQITPSGYVYTLAGAPRQGATNDGAGIYARFLAPAGMAIDGSGNLDVADTLNSSIRQMTLVNGIWNVNTIGGLSGVNGSADGTGPAARFNGPQGVAVDAAGNVYVGDTGNNTIRKGVLSAYFAANSVPYVSPPTNASLMVTLLPAIASGQWRFPWELTWRDSGTTATNLTAGNYPIEFSSPPGYLPVPNALTTYVAASVTNYLTNQYYPTISSPDATTGGSLTVFFQASPPTSAGWRLLGDTGAFLSSGFTTNLLPATYLLEFAQVPGFVHIPIFSVQISAGTPAVLQETYQPAAPLPAGMLLPAAVPAEEITDTEHHPYGFNGQLETDAGYGSGVAATANVVLTAAHLVFNDQTLSYVGAAWWYPQEEAPQFVPEPQAAQGWLVLSGYASQRSNDIHSTLYTADQSSPQSRDLDVAALYFQSPVAGGAFGGYLPSDASPNPWLTGGAEKLVVGYPVDGSDFNQTVAPGQMYAVGPGSEPLSLATDPVNDQQVYTASWFLSYPGNSGGPVYVEFGDYYYPAGVYLGTLFNGSAYVSAVRSIDSSVVNLITNAQALVSTGVNNSGGGVITIIPSSDISSTHPGYLLLHLGPPSAVAAGAAWELAGQSTDFYSTANPSLQEITAVRSLALQFKPIPGWNLPTNRSVTVTPGLIVTNFAEYTVTNPVLSLDLVRGLGISGTANTTYQIQSNSTVTGGLWVPFQTNTLTSPGFNLITNKPSPGYYRALWLTN